MNSYIREQNRKPETPEKYIFFFRPGRRRNVASIGGSERPSQGRVAIVVGKKEDDDQPPPSPTT
eukprot:scaffold5047_cov127-Skeletonema_menzelii.AAC.7